jgi:hypothetical protein
MSDFAGLERFRPDTRRVGGFCRLPTTLLICCGLWAIADIKLMTKSGTAIGPIAESVSALWDRMLRSI